MKGAINNLMQQAQKMQEDMQKLKAELETLEVTGESGGGMVSLLMTGTREVRKMSIDSTLVGDDKEMLEDLVVAAINDAVHKVAKLKKDKMGDITAGIPMPPGFKLPF